MLVTFQNLFITLYISKILVRLPWKKNFFPLKNSYLCKIENTVFYDGFAHFTSLVFAVCGIVLCLLKTEIGIYRSQCAPSF